MSFPSWVAEYDIENEFAAVLLPEENVIDPAELKSNGLLPRTDDPEPPAKYKFGLKALSFCWFEVASRARPLCRLCISAASSCGL